MTGLRCFFCFSLDKFKLGQKRQAKAATGDTDRAGEGNERSGAVLEHGREEGSSDSKEKRARKRQYLLEGRIQSNPTSQHYLQWKENTLRLAREKLVQPDLEA